MSDILFYINTDFINFLKKRVDLESKINKKQHREYCGNFKKTDGEDNILEKDTEYKGLISGRASCNFEDEKNRDFYHTHPISSKAYPSYEDILSIAKYKYEKRRISVIGTLWGIWYIYKEKDKKEIEDEKTITELKDVYNVLVEKMYKETSNDKFKKVKNYPYRSKKFSKDIKDVINDAIYSLNGQFFDYCTIGFVPWNVIDSIRGYIIPFYKYNKGKELGFFLRKSVKAPRKSVKAPRKSVKAPRKSVKAPRKSVKASRKSVKAPRKSVKAPRKSVKAPRKSVKAPRKSVKAPRKSVKAPRKSVKAPRKSVKAPRKSVKAPRKSVKAPRKSVKAPRKLRK
jgi:hypothetical protein